MRKYGILASTYCCQKGPFLGPVTIGDVYKYVFLQVNVHITS